jgi:hypothetical protein
LLRYSALTATLIFRAVLATSRRRLALAEREYVRASTDVVTVCSVEEHGSESVLLWHILPHKFRLLERCGKPCGKRVTGVSMDSQDDSHKRALVFLAFF